METKWISVETELPEETIQVAVWVKNTETPKWSKYCIGMNENAKWYLEGGRVGHEIVTHWMPLPKAPKQ